jgi:hypothetical protein
MEIFNPAVGNKYRVNAMTQVPDMLGGVMLFSEQGNVLEVTSVTDTGVEIGGYGMGREFLHSGYFTLERGWHA